MNSYHQGYEWSDDIVNGVLASIRDRSLKAELHIEYADLRRHRDPKYLDSLTAFYKTKFANLPFAAVIVSDDYAVQFLLARQKELFPRTPIVFCGVNQYEKYTEYVTAPEYRDFLAGVAEVIDLEETARLALRLHPRTRRIVLVGEDDPDHERDLGPFFPGIEIRRIRTLRQSIEQTGSELRRLPPDSVVLISAVSRDANNRQFSTAEGTRAIAEYSPVPVYALKQELIGARSCGWEGDRWLRARLCRGETDAGDSWTERGPMTSVFEMWDRTHTCSTTGS